MTPPAASVDTHPRLRPRGSNQEGVRQYNERVVLQTIRLHGALPKADLARLTHLSPQTVSIIIERLQEDDLVIKQARVRGKVGQPSVPISLNPDGAFSVGIKVGRRNMDALLVDFTGRVRQRHTLPYPWPDPDTLFDDIARHVALLQAHLHDTLGAGKADRLLGVGVAAPFSLGGWQTLLGMPESKARTWQAIDIPSRMQDTTRLPVHFVKDTSAACVAELVAGRGRSVPTFLYVFVDTFIGGGLVIDSHLRGGIHGNAGAVGSLPLSPARAGQASLPAQLLSVASLVKLEQAFEAHGLDPMAAYDERAMQSPWLPHTAVWVDQTARGIAMAVNTTACVLDLEGVIVDGSFSRGLLASLLAAVQSALAEYNWEGIFEPQVMGGMIGSDARALGGALMPLYANFAPDRELFLKLEA